MRGRGVGAQTVGGGGGGHYFSPVGGVAGEGPAGALKRAQHRPVPALNLGPGGRGGNGEFQDGARALFLIA